MKKFLLPVLFILSISINTFAQDKSAREKKGDKFLFRYDYNKAIDAYSQANPLSIEGQRNLAKSYYKLGKSEEAEITFQKVISNSSSAEAQDFYNYAMILKANGKYTESNIAMDKFASMKPSDLRAMDYTRNKANFSEIVRDKGLFSLVSSSMNSGDQDFGTSYYKKQIVFSTTKLTKLFKKKYNLNGKPFLSLYKADIENNDLKNPENFSKDLNGKLHNGPASFSNDGNFMAFTSNNAKDKSADKIVELQLYFSTFSDDKWSKETHFTLNNKGFSVGHPSLSADGRIMYFVSDMPGGFGGSDIYKITKSAAGDWGVAQNLGNKINTEGDEMFPFFLESEQVLYFASDGRFGLGGLDVFMSKFLGADFDNSVNMGYPLNSRYDDFAYIVNNELKTGFISSNRDNGKGSDDIYTVKLEERKQLNGVAQQVNGKAIPFTFITLMDENEKILDTLTSKKDGSFIFFVDNNKKFKLKGQKDDFLEGNNEANTLGKEIKTTVNLTLTIIKADIIKNIEVGKDLGKIVDFDSRKIYFDFDRSNIRPDAERELSKIAFVLNQNPTMEVELFSYTDCRNTKEYNQILSDLRAVASLEYLRDLISTPERIYGKGYGEAALVNKCACEGEEISPCSDEQHQENRRTEFIIRKK